MSYKKNCSAPEGNVAVTPSTQSNLFPILICFFLIPKKIPFLKTI